MRRYETITIIDPDLSEEDRKPVLDRISELIAQQDGFLAIFDEWGSKKLAYEIKKKSHGYYVRVDYCGSGALVNEIERFFRIDDRILKYMTVLLDEEADIESIKNEIALMESEAKKAAVSREPEPEPISEETTDTGIKAGKETEPSAPSDETDSEPPSVKTASTEADTESEAEPAAPSDETASKPPSEKTATAQAGKESEAEPAAPSEETASKPPSKKTTTAQTDKESETEPAAPSEETASEPLSEKTAESEIKPEDGPGNDQTLTADSKKEEQ